MLHGLFTGGVARLKSLAGTAVEFGIERGLPPSWFGYRRVPRETVQDYFARRGSRLKGASYETIHPVSVAHNPLPCNIAPREELSGDAGWWGYAMRDVPERRSEETFIATIPDALVVCCRHPQRGNNFYPAILTDDRHALDLREIRFRPLHAEALRLSSSPVHIEQATWFLERVYDNHSHWLTAHLPKLLVIQERGLIGETLFPPERTETIDTSLRMLGLLPEELPTFDPSRPLRIKRLTIVGSDRFRPELLRLVPPRFHAPNMSRSWRRIFISRAGASRRRLLNEQEIWTRLQPAGFERVAMETLDFKAQVALMQETAVLWAPHGAGLTNMMFCPPGAHVVEMADPSFPNPNFYALASAMGHRYWLLRAEPFGNVHPLDQDLRVDPMVIDEALAELLAQLDGSGRGRECNKWQAE